MLDHAGLTVSNASRSRKFFDAALAAIGYELMMEVPLELSEGRVVLGYGSPPNADFWITEGVPSEPPVHFAFRVESRAKVHTFYEAAIAAGGKCNGPPGLRPRYHPNYYGAFVLDPDGHNIEAVCREPS